MAIKVDLAAVERCYRNMSDEELASVKRDDLTTEAAGVYDAEAVRRSTPEWKAIKPLVYTRVIDLESPAHRRMEGHVTLIAYSSLVATLLFALGAISQLATKGPLGQTLLCLAVVFLPIFIGLKRRKPWGRIIAIIWAILLVSIPFSWYVLWVLTRSETRHLFGLTSPTLADFRELPVPDPSPSESETVNNSGPQTRAPLIDAGPPSTFWLTWKEFVTVIGVLVLLFVLSVVGEAYRTNPPYKDPFDTAQLFGTIGGVYIVVFIARKLRGQRRFAISSACAKCGGNMTAAVRFCSHCGYPVGGSPRAA